MIRPKKIIRSFKGYRAPEPGRSGIVRLDMSENISRPSDSVMLAVSEIGEDDISMYPEYLETEKAIGRYVGIDPKNVMLTNGSDEALRLIMEAYISEDDTVVIMEPSFAMFKFYAKLQGARVVSAPLGPYLEFIEEPYDDLSDPRMIVLCNPNNPTGTMIPQESILRIADKYPDSIILVDEAYYEFLDETVIPFIKNRKNIVVTRTFSKAFGLAGIRAGALIADETVLATVRMIASPYMVSSLTSKICLSALTDTDKIIEDVKDIIQTREWLSSELSARGYQVYPSYANFLMVDMKDDAIKVMDGLKKKGFLVRDRTQVISGGVRISIGPRAVMEDFIKAFDQVRFDPEKYDAFLFDMDGVLIDVSGSYMCAIQKTASEFLDEGLSMKEIEDEKKHFGMNSDWICVQSLLRKRGRDVSLEEIQDVFDKIYVPLREKEKALFDEDRFKAILKIKKSALVTGRPRREAYYSLEKYGLTRFFRSIITLDDVKKGKPDPEGIIKAVRKIGAERAIYIGDTVDDMMAARQAGIDAIGISSSDSDRLLRDAGAVAVFKDINEVI